MGLYWMGWSMILAWMTLSDAAESGESGRMAAGWIRQAGAAAAEPDTIVWLDALEIDAVLDLEQAGLPTLNRLNTNGSGILAFLDWRSEQAVVMDGTALPDLRGLHRFGDGIGSGPRQFANAFDVTFASPQELWVTDPPNGRISKWHLQTGFQGVLAMGAQVPSRIAACEDGSLVTILQTYSKQGMFMSLAPDGDPRGLFHRIPRFDRQSVYHRDGALACDGTDLIYAAHYMEHLFRFSAAGEMDYRVPIHGFTPNTDLVVQGVNEIGPYITRSPDARRSIGELMMHDGILFAGFSDRPDGAMVRLDLYNPSTGRYMASLPLREGMSDLAIDGTGLYAVTMPVVDRPQRLIRMFWRRQDVQSMLSGNTSSNPWGGLSSVQNSK